jgi:hypothetical protein
MAAATVDSGTKVGLSPLERHAAVNALAKLTIGGETRGVSSVFGGVSIKSATLSGGTIHTAPVKTAAGTPLVSGLGADTFAGGVRSTVSPTIQTIGSDTVVAGSAFTKTELTAVRGRALSGDTISVAGSTAAGVKAVLETKPTTGHTITLADKTTITLSGIPHNFKPH